MNAKFLALKGIDYVKGFVVAVLTAVLTAVIPVIQTGTFPTGAQLKTMLISGLAAGIAYLIKNMLTNSKDELFKPEPK
jgi:hypothetical protein